MFSRRSKLNRNSIQFLVSYIIFGFRKSFNLTHVYAVKLNICSACYCVSFNHFFLIGPAAHLPSRRFEPERLQVLGCGEDACSIALGSASAKATTNQRKKHGTHPTPEFRRFRLHIVIILARILELPLAISPPRCFHKVDRLPSSNYATPGPRSGSWVTDNH